MTEKDNLELVAKATGAVFNGHDLTAIEKYWAENYIQHNPMAKSGREEFKEFFQQWIKATPDLKWEPILHPVWLRRSGLGIWKIHRNIQERLDGNESERQENLLRSSGHLPS